MSNKDNFKSLGICSWITNHCNTVGIRKPTPVQSACIPPILNGKDVSACAKTGSGKTAAFALPIIQALEKDPYGIFALVLTASRELAAQIADQFSLIGQPIHLKTVCVTGGRDYVEQIRALSELPHILVATPGRLSDLLEYHSGDLASSLSKLQFLVLDEADRLLEGDFEEQLSSILSFLPTENRQTLMFSATQSSQLKKAVDSARIVPFEYNEVDSSNPVATVDLLDQRFVVMEADKKDSYLVVLLDAYLTSNPSSSVIIFTNQCKYCQVLGMLCEKVGIQVQVLHSFLPQRKRLASLNSFRSTSCRVLLATDVAARGLDLPAVDLCVCHNVPNAARTYVHRVGRTARAGRAGIAVSLVTQFDISLLKAIEAHTGVKMREYSIDASEVARVHAEILFYKLQAERILLDRHFGAQKEWYKKKRLLFEKLNKDQPPSKQQKRYWM